mmetsp:Transcript_34659/g.80055  ORF Transcript_34659/g.80055 Transcript_34659/m.80055 type:complete len:341 (-) Transcript_34659:123-1145(-)
MGPDATAALCALLRANSTLTELRLAEQHAGWATAAEEALAEALADNTALVKLSLSSSRSARARDLLDKYTWRNRRAARTSGVGKAACAPALSAASSPLPCPVELAETETGAEATLHAPTLASMLRASPPTAARLPDAGSLAAGSPPHFAEDVESTNFALRTELELAAANTGKRGTEPTAADTGKRGTSRVASADRAPARAQAAVQEVACAVRRTSPSSRRRLRPSGHRAPPPQSVSPVRQHAPATVVVAGGSAMTQLAPARAPLASLEVQAQPQKPQAPTAAHTGDKPIARTGDKGDKAAKLQLRRHASRADLGSPGANAMSRAILRASALKKQLAAAAE